MELRDSTEIVRSSAENPGSMRPRSRHSHFQKPSTHLGSRYQRVCAQTAGTLPARKFHLRPVEGLLIEP